MSHFASVCQLTVYWACFTKTIMSRLVHDDPLLEFRYKLATCSNINNSQQHICHSTMLQRMVTYIAIPVVKFLVQTLQCSPLDEDEDGLTPLQHVLKASHPAFSGAILTQCSSTHEVKTASSIFLYNHVYQCVIRAELFLCVCCFVVCFAFLSVC